MLRRKFSALLLAAVIGVTSLGLTSCSSKNTVANLQAVVAGAQDVVNAMSASDPGLAKAQKFLDDARALLTAYQAAVATNPAGCSNLATTAGNIVSAFQSVILPLLGVNPLLAAAVAGIDVALRLVASHFNSCITAVLVPTTKGATARKVLGESNVGALKTAQTTFTNYLNSPPVQK